MARCFSKLKKTLIDFSPSSYQLHLLLIFIPFLFLRILHLVVACRLFNLYFQHTFHFFQNTWSKRFFYLCFLIVFRKVDGILPNPVFKNVPILPDHLECFHWKLHWQCLKQVFSSRKQIFHFQSSYVIKFPKSSTSIVFFIFKIWKSSWQVVN